jgi:hypothetical protein
MDGSADVLLAYLSIRPGLRSLDTDVVRRRGDQPPWSVGPSDLDEIMAQSLVQTQLLEKLDKRRAGATTIGRIDWYRWRSQGDRTPVSAFERPPAELRETDHTAPAAEAESTGNGPHPRIDGSWNEPKDLKKQAPAAKPDRISSEVVYQNAYTQGLVWQIAGAHPMGYSNLQFGYWSRNPRDPNDPRPLLAPPTTPRSP